MTNEQKFKMFTVLCALAPYHVKCKVDGYTQPLELIGGFDDGDGNFLFNFKPIDDKGAIQAYVSEIKPYLRQPESMMQVEKDIFADLLNQPIFELEHEDDDYAEKNSPFVFAKYTRKADAFLLSNFFDTENLIEDGLALKATKNMYHIEKKYTRK